MKTTITIQTKKNETQECTFEISQSIPYPRIANWDQRWENDDNVLFSRYGNPPKGLSPIYYCSLLRSDMGPDYVEKGNRLDHAGYKGAPGTIVFRGKDLGGMSFRLEKAFNRDWYTRELGCPDAIKAQIRDHLSAFIDRNEKKLYRDAVKVLRANIRKAVSDAKANIKKAENEAREALKALKY